MSIKKKPKDNGFDFDEYVRRKRIKIKSKSTKLSVKEAKDLLDVVKDLHETTYVDNIDFYRVADF